MKPIKKTIDRAIAVAGDRDTLAEQLDVHPNTITMWRLREQVPAKRVLDIEKATHGIVTRHDLRPDLYPVEEDQSPA